MNYIELINQFWRIRRYKPLTAYEADLYYYLMQECNNRKWLNPFNLSTNLICAELGIARKTLSDLRNRLKQKGLIDFVEGQKNKSNAVYKLIYVTEGNIQGNELGNIQGNIDGNIQGNHLNTKHKHKLNNIPPLSPKMEDESPSHTKELDTGPINELCFENVWNLYDKKQDKKKAEAKWNKLSIENKRKALAHIPKYVQTTPDKQFRKNLTTYLNGECWDNELTFKTSEDETTGTHYREFD